MKTPDNNSINFEDVTLDEARNAGSPADASKRNFDIAQEREKEFEDMVSKVSSFEELADIVGKLGEYVPTSQGPKSVVEVVAMPVHNLRDFYTTLANNKDQRPNNNIIGEMLLHVTRTYNLRQKVAELVAKELDSLFP